MYIIALFQMDVSPHDYSKEIHVDDTLEPKLEDTTHPMEVESPCEEPHISLIYLSSFSTPQTLNFFLYIKHCKVIVLIESGRTHNFIESGTLNPMLFMSRI